MSLPTRLKLTSLSVLTALIFTALMTVPAFADDGVPPAEPAPPAEEGGEAADPAEGQIESGEVETPLVEAAPTSAGEPLAEQGALPADVPGDTTIMVVSEEGEVLPLATEEAAEILAVADPIWCPASVGLPADNLLGCSPSFANLNLLFNWLKANEPAGDGVIWVEKGDDPSGVAEFELDGSTESTMAQYKLTIKGGWNGLGTKTVDTNNPSVLFGRLNIINWLNDVTISDIFISSAPVSIAGEPALEITTTGKITLTRVKVEDGAGSGAKLDNRSVDPAKTSDVLITLGQFIYSANGYGLRVYSDGMITLAGVIASNNTNGDGAYLNNTSAGTAKNVVLTSGVFEFNDNDADGLAVASKGAITLKDITADGNGEYGALLDNTYGTNAGVTLSGVNLFSENGDSGLYVNSYGPVSLNSLVANANGIYGATIWNSGGATAQPVKLTGTSQFKYNDDGLEIYSKGAITLSNVTAERNGGTGVLLDNTWGTNAGVTLTGVNVFSENYLTGLSINTLGAVKLNSVTADRNGLTNNYGYGASINNSSAATAQPVALSGTSQFNGNYSGGLYVWSRGAVTLSNTTASGNTQGWGASLGNTASGATSPQNVTLAGYGRFNDNYYSGVSISTYGVITAANLTASDNGTISGYSGAELYNAAGTIAKAVTLTGTNTFDGNGGNGLYVDSLGAITVNNAFARGNGSSGMYLNNNLGSGTAYAVAVNGTSEFGGNGWSGVRIFSRGNITVQNFDSHDNGSDGVNLVNSYAGSVGSVTVGTSKSGWCNGLWDNNNYGMQISSYGAVTLSNLCAWSNGIGGSWGDGVEVTNDGAATAKGVTLKGANSFNGNYLNGLDIYTKGPIVASSLSASGNLNGYGAYLVNTAGDPLSPQNVTLTGTNVFSGNRNSGLYVWTYGTIAASNLTATENGLATNSYGAVLDNAWADPTLPRNVTLTGTNTFSGNGYGGLSVASRGAIAASNVRAEGNVGGEGASMSNAYVAATGGVTLSGTSNVFSYNDSYGLWVWSYGPISAAGLQAEGNTDFGARLYNYGASSPKTVTLTGSSNRFDSNGGRGLDISSKGAITVANLNASDNGDVGAMLSNIDSGPAAPQKVTLSGTSTLNENWYDGLYIWTVGAVTLNNVTASGNGQSASYGAGVYVDGYEPGATTANLITLTGYGRFNDNNSTGLGVESLGAIKANSLEANRNGGTGVYLWNHYDQFQSAVTLTGTNSFGENAVNGLAVFSNGAITLANVSAVDNDMHGAWLDTSGLLAPQNVTLTGTNSFTGNGDTGVHFGDGLVLNADGQISISNLTASWNAGNGATLDNYTSWWSGTPGLTLSGTNNFVGNYYTGLYFDSVGTVSLSKITADDNGVSVGGSGVDGATDGNITFTCGSLTGNGTYGWYLETSGLVTLKGVYAYGNGINTFLAGGGTLVAYRAC